MLSANLKAPVTRIITPLCRGLLAAKISPNMVTSFGAFASIASSFYFFTRGEFVTGAILNTLFTLFDLLDGTMARLSGGGTKWGAVLDSTLDRVTDGAILISVAIYFHSKNDKLLSVVLLTLLGSFLVPYIRARAEALGIECSVGIAERTERLIIALLGIGLAGFGISFALTISMWGLLVLSWITVVQRMNVVMKSES